MRLGVSFLLMLKKLGGSTLRKESGEESGHCRKEKMRGTEKKKSPSQQCGIGIEKRQVS